MNKLFGLPVVLAVACVTLVDPSMAGQGGFAGVSQCYINGRFVTVKGNCPATGGGGAPSRSGPVAGQGGQGGLGGAAASGLYGAGYALGYAFGQWLMGGDDDANAEAQRRAMMEELRRRQAEAERQHREEEARRLAAMYTRLASTLKLSGLPDLKLKDAGGSQGLRLKLGDEAAGHAGIKGLPGIYLNEGNTPYGIPGLPGIYTGGPGQGSGLSGSGLKLKIGEGSPAATQPASDVSAPPAPLGAERPSDAPAAVVDLGKMTPQQLADVAEMVSKLPPEEQQGLWSAAQGDTAARRPQVGGSTEPSTGRAVESLERQAAASQAAAAAPGLEDASDQARAGFDRPLDVAAARPPSIRAPDPPNPSPPSAYEGIDADAAARSDPLAYARWKLDHANVPPPAVATRAAPGASTPPPSPPLPSRILLREREALEPSPLARIEHARSRAAAQSDADDIAKIARDDFKPAALDPAVLAKVSRLVERIRALSPYPEDPVAIRFCGAPVSSTAKTLATLAAFATSDAIYFNEGFLKSNPTDDEILFLAGHELAHVQRGHYAGVLEAIQRHEEDARNLSSNPKVEELMRKIWKHDLDYEQELEAERLGTTMALAAGAKLEALRDRYARAVAKQKPRSAEDEQIADHPTWRRIYEEQRKVWGDLIKIP